MYKHLPRLFALLLLAALAVILGDGAGPVVAQGTGSISGRVIHDLNGDGAHQAGEPGLEGWLVVLTKADPDHPREVITVAETTTGLGGLYEFSGVEGGVYTVRLPCEGQPAAQWAGTYPDLRPRHWAMIYPPRWPVQEGLDMLVKVMREPVRMDGVITGRVVNDLDRDGAADPREPGLAGWRVTIRRDGPLPICADAPSGFGVTTDSDGFFAADGLFEGTYRLGYSLDVNPPRDGPDKVAHWAITSPDVPELTLTRSNMSASVSDICIVVLEGSASVSGVAFRDLNGNLKRDEGEPLAHPLVTSLSYDTGRELVWVQPAIVQFVDENWRYGWEGLMAGEYVISVHVSVGVPNQSREFRSAPVTLAEGETRDDVDVPVPPLPATPTPAPTPTPVLTPAPTDGVAPPATGTGSASGTSGPVRSHAIAIVLAVAGALAVSGSLLVGRRRTRRRPASSR